VKREGDVPGEVASPPPAVPYRIVKWGWAAVLTALAIGDALLLPAGEGGRWRSLVDRCMGRPFQSDMDGRPSDEEIERGPTDNEHGESR
jgi:hypothetical protein